MVCTWFALHFRSDKIRVSTSRLALTSIFERIRLEAAQVSARINHHWQANALMKYMPKLDGRGVRTEGHCLCVLLQVNAIIVPGVKSISVRYLALCSLPESRRRDDTADADARVARSRRRPSKHENRWSRRKLYNTAVVTDRYR